MLWSQLCLTVDERNLSFISEMLSSRRLQEVRKMIVETQVTALELRSVIRHPGLRQLKMKNWISSVEPGLLAGAVRKLVPLNVWGVELSTQKAVLVLLTISADSQLKSLDMSGYDLSSVKPVLLTEAIENLETLIVRSVELTTQQAVLVLSAISEDLQLKSLDMSDNNLSSVEPGLLARAVKKLETLKVSSSRLTTQQKESILAAIYEDSQLKSLDISGNNLSSVEPGLLAGTIKKLETLNLENVRLTKLQTESILAAISEDSQLKSLDISVNDLSSVNPRLLTGAVKRLETLNVEYVRLTKLQSESIFAAISEDSQLKSLNIKYNDLSSVKPKLLARAVNKLETANMHGTRLTSQQYNMILSQSLVHTSLVRLRLSYVTEPVDRDLLTQTRHLFY